MSIRVYVDGQVRKAEDAVVSVFDRGFLFGDSVYETMAVVSRRPIFLADHLDRLERSAARLYFEPQERRLVEQAIRDTIAASDGGDLRLRVILTRGKGEVDIDPATARSPTLIVIAQPLRAPTQEMIAHGVAVEVVGASRGAHGDVGPDVKSGNYLGSVLAIAEARRRRPGANEAILCTPSGSIAEGATSNVFLVAAGKLQTAAVEVGILDGITRAKVLALARASGVETDEVRFLPPSLLHTADEVFLTSAVRGILPVTIVDGARVGSGTPGPVTRKLLSLYEKLTAEAS